MKTIRIFQLIDLLVQSVLIIGCIVAAILAVKEPGFLFWSLFLLFPLGMWQLFSALLLGFGRDDYYRRIYLITAITFSSLFFSVGYLLDRVKWSIGIELDEIAFFVGIFISFVAAIVYLIHSYRTFYTEDKLNTHDIA